MLRSHSPGRTVRGLIPGEGLAGGGMEDLGKIVGLLWSHGTLQCWMVGSAAVWHHGTRPSGPRSL